MNWAGSQSDIATPLVVSPEANRLTVAISIGPLSNPIYVGESNTRADVGRLAQEISSIVRATAAR